MLSKNDKLVFDDGEHDSLLEDLQRFELPETRFSFINDHKGFRRGKRHVLLGTTGTGKSTLTRSLILDLAKSEYVLLYSTEEDAVDTKSMLALRGVQNEEIGNLSFVFEDDVTEACKGDLENLTEWKRIMGVKILNSQAKIFVFDNITTSNYYDSRPFIKQIEFLKVIDDLAREFNVAFLVVAHTKKGIKDDQQALITPDDVAGPSKLVRNAPYVYVYQQLVTMGAGNDVKTFGIVRVKKARLTGEANLIYLLNYNFEKKEYFGDVRVSHKRFNELYNERVKLGGKK